MKLSGKHNLPGIFGATLLLAGCSMTSTMQPYTPGLAVQMKDMQYWTHKLALSIDAGNLELADFYHHELEEAVEDLIDSIDTYDGFAIAQLTSSMLMPALETLEDRLDDDDVAGMRVAFSGVVQACNSCHQVTEHAFIRITDGFGNNPFNQVFGW
jgi:mono/diheme cytochrome c family protein